MKMGVTTQLASQAKLSKNTSCVSYSTTKVMNSEQNDCGSYSDTFTHLGHSSVGLVEKTRCFIHV